MSRHALNLNNLTRKTYLACWLKISLIETRITAQAKRKRKLVVYRDWHQVTWYSCKMIRVNTSKGQQSTQMRWGRLVSTNLNPKTTSRSQPRMMKNTTPACLSIFKGSDHWRRKKARNASILSARVTQRSILGVQANNRRRNYLTWFRSR